jgi:hypothetical protein
MYNQDIMDESIIENDVFLSKYIASQEMKYDTKNHAG